MHTTPHERQPLLTPPPPPPAPGTSQQRWPVRVSSRGVDVFNKTYDLTLYVAIYYKRLGRETRPNKSKKKQRDSYFRFTSAPFCLRAGSHVRLAKPSSLCGSSYGATLFFSTSLDVLIWEIPDRVSDRIASHSVSLTQRIYLSVREEILAAYNHTEWRHRIPPRPIRQPDAEISVRTPYDDLPDTDVSQELQNGRTHGEDHNEKSSHDGAPHLEPVAREQLGRRPVNNNLLRRTSSVPQADRKARFYRPPKQTPLCQEETEVFKQRQQWCQQGLHNYIPELEQVVAANKGGEIAYPTIGLCLSGGSYRSLVASLGALQGMQDTGLLDCVSYLSCLSGTIWSAAMWYTFPENNLQDLINALPSYISESPRKQLLSSTVWKAYQELQQDKKRAQLPRTRVVDLYCAVLSDQMLAHVETNCFRYPLSQLADLPALQRGEMPIPLFSAVYKEPHGYEWLEVSPFEVGSDYLSAYVPTKGFGSTFVAGQLTRYHPEISLGQLMGLSSAVFCLTTHRLWKEILLSYDLHPLPVEVDTVQGEEVDPTTPVRESPRHKNTITTPRRALTGSHHEISAIGFQNFAAADLALSLVQRFDGRTPGDDPIVLPDDSSSSSEDDEDEDDYSAPSSPIRSSKSSILSMSINSPDHDEPSQVSTDASSVAHGETKPPHRGKRHMARRIEKKFRKMKLTNKYLVQPATIPNFSFGLANPMKREKFLQLVDAGMDYCIPFPPMLRQGRNINVIIVVDMSAPPDSVEGNSLQAAIEWARNHGYQVPDAKYERVKETENIFVFQSDQPATPTIVYVPLRKNPAYGDFDPVENFAEGGYCSTSSVTMNAEQIEELSGLFRTTFRTTDEVIKQSIFRTLVRMNTSSSL